MNRREGEREEVVWEMRGRRWSLKIKGEVLTDFTGGRNDLRMIDI
jgi:hypothetical protein